MTNPGLDDAAALEGKERAAEPAQARAGGATEVDGDPRGVHGARRAVRRLGDLGADGAGDHEALAAGVVVLRREPAHEEARGGGDVGEAHLVQYVVRVRAEPHEVALVERAAHAARGAKKGEIVRLRVPVRAADSAVRSAQRLGRGARGE